MINLFSPAITQPEIKAAGDTLQSGWIGKGAKVTEFEADWGRHIEAAPEQVVSTNSCTEALFTAVNLLDIGPGDEVIIPTIHFIGAAQAVIAAGARPVFCDVDYRTLNATAKTIAARYSRKTRAVILNHYGGVPCELDWIKEFNGISIIEDAACAPMSTYKAQPIGTFGDIGVWSFDAMKIITTGDGGMMYFKDKRLADRARKMLYLGTSTESGLSSNADKWWEYGVTIKGARRSIMNDVSAVMGLEQLKRINRIIDRRLELYLRYDIAFNTLPVNVPLPHDGQMCSYYFYWIQTTQRDELAKYLREQGIYTSFRYYPLHWAYKTGDCLPNAERAARETLLLPLHCNLSDGEVDYISQCVSGFYSRYSTVTNQPSLSL